MDQHRQQLEDSKSALSNLARRIMAFHQEKLAEINHYDEMSQMNPMEMNRMDGYDGQHSGGYDNYSDMDMRDGHYDQNRSFDGYNDDYRNRESQRSEEDQYSRGRDRDREMRRDRGRDRDRRRDHDRDHRGQDWERDRGRHHGRERGDRDRSPGHDQYNRGDGYGQDYDMDDDMDNRMNRRNRSRNGRNDRHDDKWTETNVPSRKLILRGMHVNVDEKMINEELVKCALPAKDVRLIRRSSGVSRGFAFVEFHNLSDAQRWMELTQGVLMLQGQYRASLAYSIQKDRGGSSQRDNNMQRFDWVCSKCLGHNFKRRDFCFNCNLPRKESEKGKPPDGQDEVGHNPCNTLIFRGLDALTTEDGLVTALNQVISNLTPIKNVSIVRDEMNTSRGFGFAEFHTVQASTQVLDSLTRIGFPLEVDGKQLIVNYAKNTFNTTMATIQQQMQQNAQTQYYDQNNSYQQQGQYYDPVTQQYYNYSDYYNQTSNAASSSTTTTPQAASPANSANNAAAVAHAAIQQAQAVKNLHKQVQRKTVGGTEFVTVNGVDYPVYPPPDTSQYQYEETSGFYYDPVTHLYYDSNSQYYYNSTTGQYMYWDPEKSTYLPVPTETETAQATPAENSDGSDKKDGKDKKDKEKTKVAKKIAKDMEKWAKSMNAQKDKDPFKKPMGPPPPMPGPLGLKAESATADAGFAILTKAKDDKTLMPAPAVQKPEVAASDKPGLVASYGGDSDSGDEEEAAGPVDESKLVDWTKLACLLCKRQFQSKEILSKHTQVSELHKKNLEALQRSREAGTAKIEYRDRAKERRQKYGAPGPPEPSKNSRRDREEKAAAEPTIIPEEPNKFGIGGDNIGNKLLQKMGWSSGQGLGKDNQGRTAPVEARRRNQAAGLGARGSNIVSDVGDSYREALKKTMYARYSEME